MTFWVAMVYLDVVHPHCLNKIHRILRHMVKVGRAQRQIPCKNFDVTDNIYSQQFQFIDYNFFITTF